MMDDLKVGDVVALNSGSAEMTVNWADNTHAGLVWEHEDGTHKSAEYNKQALTKVR